MRRRGVEVVPGAERMSIGALIGGAVFVVVMVLFGLALFAISCGGVACTF